MNTFRTEDYSYVPDPLGRLNQGTFMLRADPSVRLSYDQFKAKGGVPWWERSETPGNPTPPVEHRRDAWQAAQAQREYAEEVAPFGGVGEIGHSDKEAKAADDSLEAFGGYHATAGGGALEAANPDQKETLGSFTGRGAPTGKAASASAAATDQASTDDQGKGDDDGGPTAGGGTNAASAESAFGQTIGLNRSAEEIAHDLQDPGAKAHSSENAIGQSSKRAICQELFRQGRLDRATLVLDLRFTRERLTEDHVRGYHLWAKPLVRLMRRSPWVTGLIEPLVHWRNEDIAWLMGRHQSFSLRGRLVRLIGEPICRLLGATLRRWAYGRSDRRRDGWCRI